MGVNRRKNILLQLLKALFLAFIVIISVGSLVWVFMSSFKSNQEILTSAFSLLTNFNIAGV